MAGEVSSLFVASVYIAMVKLSIITINYNNQIGLQKTIESVIEQDFKNYEYLVIDGASTDGSIEVIDKYQNNIASWISEPDNGVYHAMNKGIRKATGEYLLFLNSGDSFYSSDSLSSLVKEAKGEDLVYGNILVEETNKSWIKSYPATLNFSYMLTDTLPHPATLIKKSLIEGVGYTESFRIVSDWEFFIISVCKKGASYKYVNRTISNFNYDGISSNPANASLIQEEKNKVLQSEFKTFLEDYQSYFKVQQAYELLVNSRPYKVISKIKRLPFASLFFKL